MSKVMISAVICLVCGQAFAAKTSSQSSQRSQKPAGYTKDPVCIQNNCVNPLLPALEEFGSSVLEDYDAKPWKCLESSSDGVLFLRGNLTGHASFCADVISSYSFAVPEGGAGHEVLQAQTQRAVSSYVAHLRGLGKDFWEFQKPWEEDECIQAVWKMACFTHFPRCNENDKAKYLRPCASACQGYLEACQVNCCDDGAKCTFTHHKRMSDGSTSIQKGYDHHTGPSPYCTG
mmetsp:Transcript_5972/g.10847  ORF Transcript_5972/g.10847 Transcript_5972/m.10847 type:complete len:232 (-) Transcript_5972:62-757(-)